MSLSVSSKDSQGAEEPWAFLTYEYFEEGSDWDNLEERFAILLGTLNPEYYSAGYEILTESMKEEIASHMDREYYYFLTSDFTTIYGADYAYWETFEDAGVAIISSTMIKDTVADEYIITSVTAYDSYGNEIEVTINGQTVTVVDENYVSGDTITVYIYISLNPEVVTTFDDYIDTNEGNATISNLEYGVSIDVESPKLKPNTSSYTVKYIDKYTDEEILENKEANNIAINTIIRSGNEEIEIEEYTYVEASSEYITVSEAIEDNVLILYYMKTVSVEIIKIATDTGTPLEAVEFSLFNQICEDDHDDDLIDVTDYDETCWELFGTYETDEDGIFILSELPISGTYRLVETKTVEDYLLPTGQWKIEFNYDDNLDEDEAITVDGTTLQITAISNPPALSLVDDELYLYNTPSYDLPTTGVIAMNDFYKMGLVIIVIGIMAIMVRYRRVYANKQINRNRLHARRIREGRK